MGVVAELWVAGCPVRALPDPAGGTFDAAGNFDRLIGRPDPVSPLLTSVDPYRETRFAAAQMSALIREIDRMRGHAKPGPEERGLARLKTLAVHCSRRRDAELVFLGD